MRKLDPLERNIDFTSYQILLEHDHVRIFIFDYEPCGIYVVHNQKENSQYEYNRILFSLKGNENLFICVYITNKEKDDGSRQ